MRNKYIPIAAGALTLSALAAIGVRWHFKLPVLNANIGYGYPRSIWLNEC